MTVIEKGFISMKRILLPLVCFLLLFSLFACQSLTNISSLMTAESSLTTPTLAADQINLQVLPTDIPPLVQPAIPNLVALEDTLVDIYESTSPGVVAIRVLTESGMGLGSGFVIDMEGHIITNFHVIEGITDIEIDFPSGFKTRGTVIGSDTDSDLAVIKVEAPPKELSPLPLGDSSEIQVGQTGVSLRLVVLCNLYMKPQVAGCLLPEISYKRTQLLILATREVLC